MRVRDRVGLNTSPLFLRIMLGGILLWMGLGKILDTFGVDGVPAAMLANMGVITPASPAAPATPPATPPSAPTPEKPKDGALAPGGDSAIVLASQTTPATPHYQSTDFPKPIQVRKLYTIALAIKVASEPGAGPSGTAKSPYFPTALASGSWPVNIAWACALTETLAGVGLILGLLTRLWALLIVGRMAAAIWITQIGPAREAGDAILGFLPNHAVFDAEKWRPLALQLSLLFSALALLFLGPGRGSLDHAIFSQPRTEDDDED